MRPNWLASLRALSRGSGQCVGAPLVHVTSPTLTPSGLISYSEATRYTPARAAGTTAWCTAHDKPQPRHLLYPRTRGFVATVQQLRHTTHVTAIYDVTLAYAYGNRFMLAPTMWESLARGKLSVAAEEGGAGYRFHVHVKRYELAQMPVKETELAEWLEQRWMEKGDWLEEKQKEW